LGLVISFATASLEPVHIEMVKITLDQGFRAPDALTNQSTTPFFVIHSLN